MKLYFPNRKDEQRRRDQSPHQIPRHKTGRDRHVYRYTEHDPDRTEENTEDPPDNGIIFIERFKEVEKRYLHRERPVYILKRGNETMRDHAGTAHVPMSEKIEYTVKKAMEKIAKGKIIHGLIVTEMTAGS
jgi:hypothetical protein